MYLPSHFTETDQAEVSALIDACPLATLVCMGPDGMLANHIPMLRDGEAALIGHIALANDLHRLVADGAQALAVFGGEETYVSPNWYPGKAAHHKVVPTWNYRVVHAHGAISFLHDEKVKRGIVGRLTARFEREMNGDSAWKMADAPDDFMEAQLAAIVGFRIELSRIVGKSKLSQNRETEDFDAVRQKLRARGKDDLADRMSMIAAEDQK